MIASNETRTESRRGLTEVVGLDFSQTGIKAVRMKKTRDGLQVAGVAQLPAMALGPGSEMEVSKLHLPKSVRSRNAAVAYTGINSVVRLLNVPGFSRQSGTADEMVRSQVGLEEGFRLGYTVASQPGRGKQDVSLIAVGVPDEESSWLLQVVRNSGPAPVSIEVSALSTLTAFARGPGAAAADGAVGLIEAGEEVTLMTVMKQGVPVLLRKFEFGHSQILERVARQFTVDRDTAINILKDHSFDVSQPVNESMGAMLRQLAISKEFVERKAGASVENWYLSGGLALAGYWRSEIENVVGAVKIWNPLGNLFMAQDVWPAELAGQEPRFSAAIGLAIGALEDV